MIFFVKFSSFFLVCADPQGNFNGLLIESFVKMDKEKNTIKSRITYPLSMLAII